MSTTIKEITITFDGLEKAAKDASAAIQRSANVFIMLGGKAQWEDSAWNRHNIRSRSRIGRILVRTIGNREEPK